MRTINYKGEKAARMKKIVKLRRQGSSLIITIPKDLIDDLKWKEDTDILLESQELTPDSIFKGSKILKAGKID
jgi:hypothetical protein